MEQDSSSKNPVPTSNKMSREKNKTRENFQMHIWQKNIRQISNGSVQAGNKRPQKFKLQQKQNV